MSVAELTPALAPRDEADLAEAVRAANGPLRITGGGTRPLGGAVAGTALSVAGLSGVVLHEPGALTLVVRTGTPMSEVEALLAAEGQRLPFEPMDHRALMGTDGTPTVGGMVATGASGPRRVQAGACRDFLLGARFVDGTGAVVKNGGRVMKNVTGYDLTRLMAGAHGTLGVLTEVAFKVLPVPEVTLTLHLDGLDDAQAVAAMAAALGTPFEVTGAAHLPGQGTFLRLEGFADQAAYRAARMAEALAGFGKAARIDDDPWPGIRDVTAFAGRPGDVWRLSLTPSEAPGIVARAGAEAVLYDWGGGLVWLLMAPDTDLRARLGPIPGHAMLIRAAPDTRARLGSFQPEAPAVAVLSQGLRARFDPRGILNPGRIG